VTNCATSNAGGLILWVNQGPCELGSTTNDPNYGSTKYVEAEIKYPQATTFARAVGISSETITVRSERERECLGLLLHVDASFAAIGNGHAAERRHDQRLVRHHG